MVHTEHKQWKTSMTHTGLWLQVKTGNLSKKSGLAVLHNKLTIKVTKSNRENKNSQEVQKQDKN